MHQTSGEVVAEIVRVARDGAAIIAKRSDGAYVRVASDATSSTEGSIAELSSDTRWRRPADSDSKRYADALAVASGRVITADAAPSPRQLRVPPSVKQKIAEALESYSSLLSDSDREVANRLATRTSVDRSDIEWMQKFYSNIEKAFALHGGKRGQAWAAKILAADEDPTIVASVFEYNDNYVYFAGGDNPNSTEVDTLYAVQYDDEGEAWDEDSLYVWKNGDFEYVSELPEDFERPLLVELDEESAKALADHLDANMANSTDVLFELHSINPLEANLFTLAEAEIDWEEIDRVTSIVADATGYSPAERRVNAQRQPRQYGGKFGGAPAPVGQELTSFAKARLELELPLLADPSARIDEYLASLTGPVEAEPMDGEPPLIAAGEDLPVAPVEQTEEVSPDESVESPLYLAIVDNTDKTAVLDAVAVLPDSTGAPTAWRRSDGEWVSAPEVLADLKGVTPPAVVELPDEPTIKNVLTQIDSHDGESAADDAPIVAAAFELAAETKAGRERAAKRGYALPDGSFPISNESDLKKAVKAFGRAKDKPATKRHIKKRARALNRTDLVPEDWKTASVNTDWFDDSHMSPLYGPHGELIASVVAAGAPGINDTPEDEKNVERLRQYWTTGPGGAKIRWGTDGDLTRCHRQVSKYMGTRAWGYCQNLHQRIFGVSNNERDSE